MSRRAIPKESVHFCGPSQHAARHQDLRKHLPLRLCSPATQQQRHPNLGKGLFEWAHGPGAEAGRYLTAEPSLPLTPWPNIDTLCSPAGLRYFLKHASRDNKWFGCNRTTRMLTADTPVLLGPALHGPWFPATGLSRILRWSMERVRGCALEEGRVPTDVN